MHQTFLSAALTVFVSVRSPCNSTLVGTPAIKLLFLEMHNLCDLMVYAGHLISRRLLRKRAFDGMRSIYVKRCI